jgi:hypothetical protein
MLKINNLACGDILCPSDKFACPSCTYFYLPSSCVFESSSNHYIYTTLFRHLTRNSGAALPRPNWAGPMFGHLLMEHTNELCTGYGYLVPIFQLHNSMICKTCIK